MSSSSSSSASRGSFLSSRHGDAGDVVDSLLERCGAGLIGGQLPRFENEHGEVQSYQQFHKDEGGKKDQDYVFHVVPGDSKLVYIAPFLRCANPACKCDPRDGGKVVPVSACQIVGFAASVADRPDPYTINNTALGWKSQAVAVCTAHSPLPFEVHCHFSSVNSGMRCAACNQTTMYQFLVASDDGRAELTHPVQVRSKRKIPRHMRNCSTKEIAAYLRQKRQCSRTPMAPLALLPAQASAVSAPMLPSTNLAADPSSSGRPSKRPSERRTKRRTKRPSKRAKHPPPSNLDDMWDRVQAFQHHVQGELRRKDTRIRGLETAVRQLQSALRQNTATHEWLATEIERLQRTVLHKYTQNDPAADPAQLSLDAQVAVAMLADTPLAAHTAPSNNDDWMFDGQMNFAALGVATPHVALAGFDKGNISPLPSP